MWTTVPPSLSTVAALRRPARGRARRDVRGRPHRRLALGRLPQRALPRGQELLALGEPVSAARIRLWHGHNLIWPPVAALPCRAAHGSLGRNGELGDRPRRARMLHGLPADRRCPRLARLRRLPPVAAGDRRDPRLAPHTYPLSSSWRSSGDYRQTPKLAPGLALGLAGAIKFFLWPVGSGSRRSAAPRDYSSPPWSPPRRSCSCSRSRASTTTSRSLVELGRTFDQDSYSPFGLLMQVGAPEALARAVMLGRSASRCSSPAGAARASGSLSRQHSPSRRSSGSTTTPSRRSRLPPFARASRGSGSHRSRRGAS